MQFDPAISEFIKDLKRKKPNEAGEKLLKDFLCNNSGNVEKCEQASHIGKFTHPDAKPNVLLQSKEKNSDGFLKSGNLEVETDIYRSVSYSKITKFLSIKLKEDEDGNKSILQHLEQNTSYIQNQLSTLRKDYENIRGNLIKLKKPANNATSSEIKQVYFPVEKGYHLLSVLTPSGIVLKLKETIDEMSFSDSAKKIKEAKKEEKYSEHEFYYIPDLTIVSYGGSNPQNISHLTLKLKNKSYLLPVMPPQISKKYYSLPKYNFFGETIKPFHCKDIFLHFHKTQKADWNNQNIRQARDRQVSEFIDQVLLKMWILRKEKPGWSNYESRKNFPIEQKKWLDNLYCDEREQPEFDSIIDKIIDEMSRCFIHFYEKILGNKKVLFSDEMLKHIDKMIEERKEDLR